MRGFGSVCVITLALATSPADADLKAPASAAPPRASAAREELVYLQHPDGVIVPARLAERFRIGYDPRPYFTPTAQQVRTLEAALPAFFRAAAKHDLHVTPELLRALPQYKRQYIGLDDGSHRRIWVTTACSDEAVDWRHQAIFVDDGGTCYWRVTYDLERRTFSDLEFNGRS